MHEFFIQSVDTILILIIVYGHIKLLMDAPAIEQEGIRLNDNGRITYLYIANDTESICGK